MSFGEYANFIKRFPVVEAIRVYGWAFRLRHDLRANFRTRCLERTCTLKAQRAGQPIEFEKARQLCAITRTFANGRVI